MTPSKNERTSIANIGIENNTWQQEVELHHEEMLHTNIGIENGTRQTKEF